MPRSYPYEQNRVPTTSGCFKKGCAVAYQRFEPGGTKRSWRRPTGHRKGSTNQHSEKSKKWQCVRMLWVSTSWKNENIPKNAKKQQPSLKPKQYRNQNASSVGARFLHLAFEGADCPLTRSVTQTCVPHKASPFMKKRGNERICLIGLIPYRIRKSSQL